MKEILYTTIGVLAGNAIWAFIYAITIAIIKPKKRKKKDE